MAALSEEEEFEFRLRAEREAEMQAVKPEEQPAQPELTTAQRLGRGLMGGISSTAQAVGSTAGQVLAGGVKGASEIGATAIRLPSAISGFFGGPEFETAEESAARREAVTGGLREIGASPESLAFQAGKIGTEIAGTAGIGGAIGKGAVWASPRLTSLAEAMRTGGMTAGGAGLPTRIAGGAVSGGAMAGMVSPEDAGTGAVIGGALPTVLKGARAVGAAIAGPEAPEAIKRAALTAKEAGYVIPPTQVKPTLTTRMVEGLAGKLTTAQMASARNQAVTNEKVMRSIGAKELSPEGIAEVRGVAGQAYDTLGQFGTFKTDDAFKSALDRAGSRNAQMIKDFPELANTEVDNLVASMKQRGQFDSQATIEAIKQFRADAAINKRSTDPAKVALGRAQNNISNALEDLIERNLQQTQGSKELLDNYRSARQILAKTYDVEKALNPATGNIDASKLSASLKKGRPMTGELREVAEFASTFPKAAQLTEKMGSLPQLSPLDYLATIGAGAATGSPLSLATLAARPAARTLALSPVFQRGLGVSAERGRLSELARSPQAEQLLYRGAPVIGAQ